LGVESIMSRAAETGRPGISSLDSRTLRAKSAPYLSIDLTSISFNSHSRRGTSAGEANRPLLFSLFQKPRMTRARQSRCRTSPPARSQLFVRPRHDSEAAFQSSRLACSPMLSHHKRRIRPSSAGRCPAHTNSCCRSFAQVPPRERASHQLVRVRMCVLRPPRCASATHLRCLKYRTGPRSNQAVDSRSYIALHLCGNRKENLLRQATVARVSPDRARDASPSAPSAIPNRIVRRHPSASAFASARPVRRVATPVNSTIVLGKSGGSAQLAIPRLSFAPRFQF